MNAGAHAADEAETEIEAYSRTLPAEARYYWLRHRPRFRYLSRLLQELSGTRRFSHILDIGMGFETLLLSRIFPRSRVDCLGIYHDPRFEPPREHTFHECDLNDLIHPECWPVMERSYDLIVFMEVLEHLYTPPRHVLSFLASILAPGGILFVTTPNAAWLKNRLKLLRGQNPFELLRDDRRAMGHVREYTKPELQDAFAATGLRPLFFVSRGLYHFDNVKDNCYSWIADHTLPSLRRTLVAIHEKPSNDAGIAAAVPSPS